jgi:ribonuclease HII
MKYPNFSEEKNLWEQGIEYVAGLDEVGRGPLAGPVVACAVIFEKNFKYPKIKVRDSKKLSAEQREEVYKILINHPQVKWGIGIVSEKIIDEINILQATKLAMVKALAHLVSKPESKKLKIGFLLLDGSFKINSKIPQKSVVKGDVKIYSCAAASIIAKITRDQIMEEYDKEYPAYNFKQHKGYGTALHLQKIKENGLCKIHRMSFVKSI